MSGDSSRTTADGEEESHDDETPTSSRDYLLRRYNEIRHPKQGLMPAFQKLWIDTERKNREANLTRFHACKSFDRNRYRDVLAYDHSRVRLLTPVDGSDYINANYIAMPLASRKYISTQGPLRNTSAHFWQMVYEQDSYAIVMVAKCRENGMPKVFQYFPSKDDVECMTFGKYRVTLLEQTENDEYIVRRLRLDVLSREVETSTNDDAWSSSESETDEEEPKKRRLSEQNEEVVVDTREVMHYQFIAWHDYDTPDKLDTLLDFLLEVRRSGLLNISKYGPPVIHCSAGIGRTGTFMLIDATLAMLSKSDQWKVSEIDPHSQLLRYRESRVGLVQTPYQLDYAWQCIIAAIKGEHGQWKELMEASCVTPDSTERPPVFARSAAAKKTDGQMFTSIDESLLRTNIFAGSTNSIDRRSAISSLPKLLEAGSENTSAHESQATSHTKTDAPEESTGHDHQQTHKKDAKVQGNDEEASTESFTSTDALKTDETLHEQHKSGGTESTEDSGDGHQCIVRPNSVARCARPTSSLLL